MNPIVLISSSNEFFPSKNTNLFFMRSAYIQSLVSAGCIPLISCYSNAKEYASIADALVLSGGDDIDPCFYNQPVLPGCQCVIQKERDIFEFELLDEFCKLNKPILGICRGLQLINVAFGGSLWQDLSLQISSGLHNNSSHEVLSHKGSICYNLFGEKFKVNSFHRQGICNLGNGLIAEAEEYSDNLIEAIRHSTKPIFAVQWHPELMPEMQPLFSYFINNMVNIH